MRVHRFLMAACVALCAAALHAEPVADQDVKALMAESGLNDALEVVRQDALEGFAQGAAASAGGDAKQQQRAAQAFGQSLTVEDMKVDLMKSFSSSLSSEETAELLAWYRSPLGRKVVQLEIAAMKQPHKGEDATDNMNALIAAGPARGELIKRYTEASQEAEVMSAFLLRMARFNMLLQAREKGQPTTPEAIDRVLAPMKARMISQIRAQEIARNARKYQALSDEELIAATEFVGRAAARHADEVSMSSLGDTMERSLRRLVELMKKGPEQVPTDEHCVPGSKSDEV